MTAHYTHGVTFLIRRGIVGVLLFAGMVALTWGLWKVTPGSLVPDEDQGFYITAVILPDGATLERTDKVVKQVEAAIRSNPANLDVISFTGFDFIGGGFRNNAATMFVTQVPWDQRTVTAAELVGELFGKTMGIKEALVLAFNPPAIFGLGTAGGYEFYLQNRGEGGAKRLDEVKNQLLARLNQDPKLGGAQTLWRANVPQLFVDVDRDKAKKAGVAIDDVFAALSATLGTYYVNDFNKYGRTWQVLMSAEPVVPQAARGHRRHLRALARRRDDPAERARDRQVQLGPGRARPLQQPARGEDPRPDGARREFRPGHRARGGDRARGDAGRLQLRLGRHQLPGEEVVGRRRPSRSGSR